MSRSRPERTYLGSDRIRRARTRNIVGGAAISLALLLRFRDLPAEIPLHFTLSSEPDLWGPKWTLFILIAVLVGLIALVTWASTKPEIAQYPVEVTEENAQELYATAERMMIRIGLAIMLIYLGFAAMYFSFPGLFIAGLGMILLLVFVVLGVKKMLDLG